MPRRRRFSPLANRPQKEWYARLALIGGLLVGGYSSITATAANVLVKVNPARAHAIAPNNGVVSAADAQDMFTRQPVADGRAASVQLAREALLQDPSAVQALTVLGLQAQLRNDTARSGRIFAYSRQLSRRELRAQIWAIENAVTRGDVDGALRQYDIALRTSPDAQGFLFPTLAAAIAEPRISAGVLRILKTDPIWGPGFIAYAATVGTNPEATLRFFNAARAAGLAIPRAQFADLVNVLFGAGKSDLAWQAYTELRKGASRNQSRDPNFSLSADTRTTFDWRAGDDPSLSVAILKSGNGAGLLDFAVPPSTGGTLVRQTELLAPGSYRLTGKSKGVDQPARSHPYWSLTCADGKELGHVAMPNSAQNNGLFSGRFTVPQGCAVQTLSLIAVSSDDIAGVSGQILEARLAPEN